MELAGVSKQIQPCSEAVGNIMLDTADASFDDAGMVVERADNVASGDSQQIHIVTIDNGQPSTAIISSCQSRAGCHE